MCSLDKEALALAKELIVSPLLLPPTSIASFPSSGVLPLRDLLCRICLARAKVRALSNILQTTSGSLPQLQMEPSHRPL